MSAFFNPARFPRMNRLSLLTTYERGKIPVVFIHGLWANPASWQRMVEALEADSAIKDAINSGLSATRRVTRSPTRPTC